MPKWTEFRWTPLPPYRPAKEMPSSSALVTDPAADGQVEATPAAPAVISADDYPIDLRQSVQDYEISLINNALAVNQFNQKKTAEALGVTYHQLRGYLKKYDLLDKA